MRHIFSKCQQGATNSHIPLSMAFVLDRKSRIIGITSEIVAASSDIADFLGNVFSALISLVYCSPENAQTWWE